MYTDNNKILKMYSLEYSDIPKVFFMPHHVGCCIDVIWGQCCILGHSYTNMACCNWCALDHSCTDMNPPLLYNSVNPWTSVLCNSVFKQWEPLDHSVVQQYVPTVETVGPHCCTTVGSSNVTSDPVVVKNTGDMGSLLLRVWTIPRKLHISFGIFKPVPINCLQPANK